MSAIGICLPLDACNWDVCNFKFNLDMSAVGICLSFGWEMCAIRICLQLGCVKLGYVCNFDV